MTGQPQSRATDPHRVAPYQRLVKMIEHELELAGHGQSLELRAAVAERSRYLRTLPNPAPPEAHDLLLRARALHSRVLIENRRLAEAVSHRRQALVLARRLARTYMRRPPGMGHYSTSV